MSDIEKSSVTEPLYAERPRPRVLRRGAVALLSSVLAAGAVGVVIWNAKHNQATPKPVQPASMVGVGRIGLDSGYHPEPPMPAAKPESEKKKEEAKKAAPPKPRSHEVLWGRNGKGDRKDQFEDPNHAIAARQVKEWTGGAEAPAMTGCMVKEGAQFEVQRRGNAVQTLRPVYGYDDQQQRECLAIRAGATVSLAKEGQDRICVTGIDNPGDGPRSLGCWEVTVESASGSGKSAIFYINPSANMAF